MLSWLAAHEYAIVPELDFLVSLKRDWYEILEQVSYVSRFLTQSSQWDLYLILCPKSELNPALLCWWMHKRVVVPLRTELEQLFQEQICHFDPADDRHCVEIDNFFSKPSLSKSKPVAWDVFRIIIERENRILFDLDASVWRIYTPKKWYDSRVCLWTKDIGYFSLGDDLFETNIDE